MGELKPIETIYNGYRFRSRLEARWAVFFDQLGIKYFYEPEGFKMSDGTMYLPDFYLPESDAFFEVKGVMSDDDMHKIEQFISESGKAVTIGYSDFHFDACSFWQADDDGKTMEPGYPERTGWLCQCRTCGKKWFMGSTGVWECRCCGEYDGDHHFSTIMTSNSWMKGDPVIEAWEEAKDALNIARQARFEHGDTPKVGLA